MSDSQAGSGNPESRGAKKVIVSIDAQGNVSVRPDPVRVELPKQKIKWKLDSSSVRKWKLEGIEWCGDPPPEGEFHDWRHDEKEASVIDRNSTRGEWRYGIRYRAKGKPGETKLFDPIIRNEPQ